MIKSIRLVNWRSHADTTLAFSEGANLLVGRMGAGKSSVMDAISFALFGTFPALERRKVRIADIFRMNESRASVSLEFCSNGSTFRAVRLLEKGKSRAESDAELYRNGSMLEKGPAAVNEYIRGVLGVDYDLFTRAIYSEQNNIDYFLTLDPRERKSEIDRLLGLDRFEAARENAVKVINRIKSERRILEERFLPGELEKAGERHAALRKEHGESLVKLESAAALIARSREELAIAQRAYDEAAGKKELHEGLSQDKIRLEAIISQLRADIGNKNADQTSMESVKRTLVEKKKRHESLRSEIAKADSELSALSRNAGSLESKVRRAEQASVDFEKCKKELDSLLNGEGASSAEARRAEMEKEAISLLSEQKAIAGSIRETEDLVARLKPGQSKCPMCERDLGAEGTSHVIEEKRRRIAQLSHSNESIGSRIDTNRKSLSELSFRLKRVNSLQNMLELLEKDAKSGAGARKAHAECAEKISAGNEAKKKLQAESISLAPEIQALALEVSRIEDLLKKRALLAGSEKGLSECSARLSQLGFDAKEFEERQRLSQERRLLLQKALSGQESLAKEAAMLKQMLSQAERELALAESASRDIMRYAEVESQLSLYHRALIETQTSLRAGLTDAINSAMKEVWSIFYPYRNYPEVRLAVSEKDYSLEILDRESWKPLEAMASGGERACAALSLRVALAVVLTPNLSWLVLDEPTHNLDSDAVKLLSDTLQTKVPDVVRQSFIITHDEGLMGADFASAYRLSRDGNGNGATKAERI